MKHRIHRLLALALCAVVVSRVMRKINYGTDTRKIDYSSV